MALQSRHLNLAFSFWNAKPTRLTNEISPK